MGEYLYEKWMKDHIVNLPEALLHSGVDGLLANFESWLTFNGYLYYDRKEEK